MHAQHAGRLGVTVASLAVLLGAVTACSSGAGSPNSAATDPPDRAAEPSADAGGSSADGQAFGCTPELVAYAKDHGYPDATPIDPAGFAIGSVGAPVPDCYLEDPYGGALRHSAFWTVDPDGALTELGGALTAAGFEQNSDYGPAVWWLNGEEPMSAEIAVGAGIQPVGTQNVLWATW